MKRHVVLCTLFMLGTFTGAIAQAADPNLIAIEAKGVFYNNTIKLRWAPANYSTWMLCRDSGYVLTRTTLASTGGSLTPEEMANSIVNITLAPKTQAEWQAALATDSLTGVAAGALFGEAFIVVGPGNEGVITAYSLNAEKDNRFGLSLFAADNSTTSAGMMNLIYTDNTVQPGWQYAYNIRPGGGLIGARQGKVVIRASDPYTLPAPKELSIVPGDSMATLSWNHRATAEHYSCYNVWRSKNNGPYLKMNEEPIVPTDLPNGDEAKVLMFISRLDNNTDSFYFKISGHSPFGLDGPYTDAISVKGKPEPLKTNVFIRTAKDLSVIGLNAFAISWEFPDSLNSKIQGFNVYQAPELDGDYMQLNASLLPNTTRMFQADNPAPTNYYKVEFVDLNNNKVQSTRVLAQKLDSIPPAAPVSIAGVPVGQDGTLRISWPGSTSPDVMGYRVFMSDQENGSYGQVTTHWVADTVFYHRVNASSLAEKKYFKVKAIDYRENMSPFSPVGIVSTPDIVPPTEPVIRKVEARADGIFVEWAPSTSKDIQRHVLLRKKKEDVEWKEVVSINTTPALAALTTMRYLDTAAQKMYAYDYMIDAVDDADNHANSRVFPIKSIGNGTRPSIQNFNARFIKSDEQIKMEWDYTNAFGASTFVIYRGLAANQLYEIASVTPQQVLSGGEYQGPDPFANTSNPGGNSGGSLPSDSFNLQQGGSPSDLHTTSYVHTDNEFKKFTKYYYGIVVKFADGTSSAMSEVKNTSAY